MRGQLAVLIDEDLAGTADQQMLLELVAIFDRERMLEIVGDQPHHAATLEIGQFGAQELCPRSTYDSISARTLARARCKSTRWCTRHADARDANTSVRGRRRQVVRRGSALCDIESPRRRLMC